MAGQWNGIAIGGPASGALAHAGITTLDALASWRRADVLALHGVGPKALGMLDNALAATGHTWRE